MGGINVSTFLRCIAVAFVFSCLCSKSGFGEEEVGAESDLGAEIEILLDKIVENYGDLDPNTLWHPLIQDQQVFPLGSVKISQVLWHRHPGHFYEWKHARIGSVTLVAGRSPNGITLFDSHMVQLAHTDPPDGEEFVAMSLIPLWNNEAMKAEIYLITATMRDLQVYEYSDGLKFVDSWRLHYALKSLSVCLSGEDSKVKIIPEPTRPFSSNTVDIYTFDPNEELSLGFSQRLTTKQASHCFDVHITDSSCSVIMAGSGSIITYTLDESDGFFKKQFVQADSLDTCKDMTTLVAAGEPRIAVVPSGQNSSVQMYSILRQNEFNGALTVAADLVMAAPVDSFRSEDMLVTKNDNGLSFNTFNATAKDFQLGYLCAEESCISIENLEGATSFVEYDDSIKIFFSACPACDHSDIATIIITSVEPASPSYDSSKHNSGSFRGLVEEFKDYQKTVQDATLALDNSIASEPCIATGNWSVVNLEVSTIPQNGSHSSRNLPDTIMFAGRSLDKSDLSIQLQKLQTEVEEYAHKLVELEPNVLRTIPTNGTEQVTIPAVFSFAGPVNVEKLNVEKLESATWAEESFHSFLSDLILFDDLNRSSLVLPCSVNFDQTPTFENVEAKHIGGIPTDDFAYASDSNVFESYIVFKQAVQFNSDLESGPINGLRVPEDFLFATNLSNVEFVNGIQAERTYAAGPTAGVEISESFASGILQKSKNQNVQCQTTIETCKVRGPVDIKAINGDDFDKFMGAIAVNNSDRVIRGKKVSAGSCSAVSLNGLQTLNSVKFPEGYVLQGSHAETIRGTKTFMNLVADQVIIDGKIGDTHSSEWVLLNPDSPQKVLGTWTIEGPVRFAGDTIITGSLGGVPVSDLELKDTLDQDLPEYHPNHHITFLFPVSAEFINASKHLNGDTLEEITRPFTFCRNEIHVPGLTTFPHGTKFHDVESTTGFINQQKCSQLLSKSTAQVFPQDVKFNSPVTFNTVNVNKRISGIDLDELRQQALFMTADASIPPGFTFESMQFLKGADIQGRINGHDNFGKNVAVLSGRDQQVFEIPLHLKFLEAKELDVERLYTEAINDFKLEQWLSERISLSDDVEFEFPVEISGLVTMDQGCTVSTINGLTTQYIQDGLLRTDKNWQEFESETLFEAPMMVHGSLETRKINGYSWHNVTEHAIPVHSDKVHHVHGQWKLDHPTFYNLIVKGETCGANLEFIEADSVKRTETSPTLEGNTRFGGRISVRILQADSEEISETLGETSRAIDAHQIPASILDSFEKLDDDTYMIESDMVFPANVVARQLQTGGTVDGVNIEDHIRNLVPKEADRGLEEPMHLNHVNFKDSVLFANGVKCNSYNNITDFEEYVASFVTTRSFHSFQVPVSFTGQVVANTLVAEQADIVSFSNTVHGYDLKDMTLQCIPLDSAEIFEMHMLGFEEPLDALPEVEISGVRLINDVPVEEYLTLHTPQEINFLRADSLEITSKQLQVRDDFGGTSILDLHSKTIFQSRNTGEIFGHKNFTNTVLAKNVTTGNHTEIHHIVYLNNGEIHSPVKFHDTLQTNDLDFSGKWNDQNLTAIEKCAAKVDQPDEITGHWEFKDLELRNDSVILDTLNNRNFTELASKANVGRQAENAIKKHGSELDNLCEGFDSVGTALAEAPTLFRSVDEQQQIPLNSTVQRILSISSGKIPALLAASSSCGISIFKFDETTEMFYNDSQILSSDHIGSWRQASVNNQSYVIYTVENSLDCLGSNPGFYLATFDSNGNLKSSTKYSDHIPITFEVSKDVDEIHGFALYEEDMSMLTVFAVDTAKNVLVDETTFASHTDFSGISVLNDEDDLIRLALLTTSDLNIVEYSKAERSFSFKSVAPVHGSPDTFQAFTAYKERQYLLVATKDRPGPRTIKPYAALELYAISASGILNHVQTLDSYDIKSIQVMYLSPKQVFVLILTSPGLNLFRFTGLSGLQPMEGNPLDYHNGIDVQVVYLHPWRYSMKIPFFFVTNGRKLTLYHSNVRGSVLDYQPDRLNHICKS